MKATENIVFFWNLAGAISILLFIAWLKADEVVESNPANEGVNG